MAHSSHTLTVSIAEIEVKMYFDCADASRLKIIEQYAEFSVSDSTQAFSLQIREQDGDEYIPIDSSPIWQVRTHAVNDRMEFESYYEKGWADRGSGRGELILRPQGDPENYLRVLYAWLCAEQSGLMLHAAGVISGNMGYVFFGPSGTGKSTIARLSLDRIVLSDDLVIVKRRGEKYWLYGVPFRGDFPESPRVNADAELAGVFALVKDSEHRVEPLALPEAIARLTSCVPFVMSQTAQSVRVIENCAALAASVPVRTLHFRREARFWELI